MKTTYARFRRGNIKLDELPKHIDGKLGRHGGDRKSRKYKQEKQI